MYIDYDQLREEGVTADLYPKQWVVKRIELAQKFIEDITGKFFEVRSGLVVTLDGTGKSLLHLPFPPTKKDSITKIEIDGELVDATSYSFVASGLDWRDNPRLKRSSSSLVWPRGYGNVDVTGSFGYVDWVSDGLGGEVAAVPALIQDLCKRIAIWNLPKLTEASTRERESNIVEESIEGYSYKLASAAKSGRFGDSMIDSLLGRFTTPFVGTI